MSKGKKQADKTINPSEPKNPTIVKLEALLNDRGWSIYHLAKEADIPSSTLGNLFKRNTEPTLPVLRRICYAFQISLSDFFSDEIPPARQDYTNEEKKVIAEYRFLGDQEQQLLRAYLHGLRRIKLKSGA